MSLASPRMAILEGIVGIGDIVIDTSEGSLVVEVVTNPRRLDVMVPDRLSSTGAIKPNSMHAPDHARFS